MNLAAFNKLLKKCPEAELSTFVQKHIFHGLPYVFSNREDEYFEFRNRIAKKYVISFHEVFIVGSGKLGFSYYKHRDSFDYNSDIDVAIVSPKLFEDFCVILRDFQYDKSSHRVVLSLEQESTYRSFTKYFTKGWIRPDMAKVILNSYDLVNEWDDFYKSISYSKSEVGDYKVVAGIFKSYDYLQKYHYEGVKKHQQLLRI